MKRLLSVCLMVVVSMLSANDTPQKFWIYFTAKEHIAFSKTSSPAELAAVTGISERALHRRAKMSSTLITVDDLPVQQSFLTQLKERGIAVQNTSRWFNAATAYLTNAQRVQLQLLPFIRSVEPVATFKRKDVPQIESAQRSFSKQSANKYSYGFSETQMNLMNAIAVHNIGISGRGVLVGMLDTGFRWKIHDALKNLKVIAEYDFIQKDSVTANEAGDSWNQDSHGTSCMSLVGGYKEGTLVSSAFNAQFILGKTEYVPTETNVEEDNWVAAIEWMESMGVDVVSSSLGYKVFDAGQKSYIYADMNGKTATTSIAATIAARKGVVVCNAMGNEGSGATPPSITTPADADSIVSVGAVQSSGVVASFSSNGPTSDERRKPDVSAQGVSVYASVPSGGFTGGFGGTSAATPLTAGVAAMILSARPELTPLQVINALHATASIALKPDNTIGWGIVNAYKAVLYNGMVIGTDPEISISQSNEYTISAYVVSKDTVNKDSVRLLYTLNDGSVFSSIQMVLTEVVDQATNSGKYSAVIPATASAPKFYIRAVDAANAPRTSPYNAPTNIYDAKNGTLNVGKRDEVPSAFLLHQNYPNPFNPSTMITYDVPVTGFVSLSVFDVLGREVRTLVQEVQTPRTYFVRFSADGLASGVYLYRLQLNNHIQTNRMMLRK
ncbi:MAG: S8 family serine peptidase [Bacteriovoracaceae bacterium]